MSLSQHVDDLIDERNELERKLAAAEARSMASEYEELRSIIDGGSESMTHEDAVRDLKDRDNERDELQRKLAAAEAALNLSTDERQTAEVRCEELTERLAAAEAERDEYKRLWKDACRVKDVRRVEAKGGEMSDLNCSKSSKSSTHTCGSTPPACNMDISPAREK